MKRIIKCKLIPLSEFYQIPPIDFQDENYSYFKIITKQGKEHISKIKRKYCSYCSNSAVCVGDFKYPGHRTAESLCKEHASDLSDDEVPQVSIPQIKSKPVILNK